MRFPEKRQHDAMQCGAACLAMICEHWSGRIHTVEEMERRCGASRRGVSMLALSEAARELGFETKGYQLSIEALMHLPLPAVIHWNGNHFVVLYKIKKGKKFYVSDPGRGHICYTLQEFRQKWETARNDTGPVGTALILTPTARFSESVAGGGRGERRSFKVLASYIREHRGSFIRIIATLAVGSALQLVMPFLTQAIVDRGIAQKSLSLIWLILLGEMMIVAGRATADFFRRRILLKASMGINISILMDFFAKMMALPMSFFDTRLTGDIMQRMGDHGRIQNFLTGEVLGIAFSIISFLIYGVVLAIYSIPIFMVFIIGSIIYGCWIAWFLEKRKKLDYERFDCQAVNQSRILQMVTCMQEIKLQGCERRRRDEWKDTQLMLFDIQWRSLRMQQSQEAGSIFINEIKNALITVFAASAVIYGNLTLGGMLAIQYIVGQLNSPVAQLLGFINSLQDVRISLERINEIHEAENEENVKNVLVDFPDADRSIVVSELDFKYTRHSIKKALDGVSLRIPAGKLTAIVGASGSGKTTLIKLMLGYYRIGDGHIFVGGADINCYSLAWWRGRCGVVMQDGVIFTESVARNIAVGDDEPDMERVREAAKMANIDSFVMGLPLRYDTVIGKEGIGISQGQKQRILIARAIYKNPDFIFLDEATNSLDAGNEREIVERLEKFYRGRTVVVAAHRLSTVRNADLIIVMDKGRLAESGKHEELIAARGLYYNLVKNQLELGL